MRSIRHFFGISAGFLILYFHLNAQNPVISADINSAFVTGGYLKPSIVVDQQGNVNFLSIYFGNYSFAIAKYNPAGSLLKQILIKDMGPNFDPFNNYVGYLMMDENENYYVLGTDYNNSHSFELQKRDSSGQMLWNYLYTGSNLTYTNCYAMTRDESGNIFVAGNYTVNNDTQYSFITKLNKNGTVKWSKSYNMPATYNSLSYFKIVVDAAGKIYTTGSTTQYTAHTNIDMLTQKFDKNGTLLWTQTYGLPDSSAGARNDKSFDMAIAPSGNVYITGQSESDSLSMTTIKYGKNGNLQWSNLYHGPGGDNTGSNGIKIFLDAAEHVFVAGVSVNDASGMDLTEVSYNKNGEQRWVSSFPFGAGAFYDDDDLVDAVMDSNQNIYLLGSAPEAEFNHELLVKYDKNGTLQFGQEYDSNAGFGELPYSIALGHDGSIYTCGDGYKPLNLLTSTYLLKCSSEGIAQWKEDYQVPLSAFEYHKSALVDDSGNFLAGDNIDNDDDSYETHTQYLYQYDSLANLVNTDNYKDGGMNRVVRDQQKNILICGFTDKSRSQPLINACNQEGKKLWTVIITDNPDGKGFATDINSDPSGNIYVTGYWKTTNGNDIFLYKFDANGNKLWSETYNGPGNSNDESYAMSVDNAGVFITGRTKNSTTYQPLLLKYDTNGNLLWTLIPASKNNAMDFGYDVVADDAGGCFVTGRYTQKTSKQGFVVMKILSDGSVAWIKYRQGNEQSSTDFGTHLIVDESGNILAEGRVMKDGKPYGISIIKFNNNGKSLWSFEQSGYNFAFDDSIGSSISYNDPLQFTIDAEGNVYIANVVNNTNDVQIYKLDNSGQQQWVYTSTASNTLIQPSPNLIVDESGSVWCLFNIYSDTLTTYDWRLLKFNQSATPQMVKEGFSNSQHSQSDESPSPAVTVYPVPASDFIKINGGHLKEGQLKILIRNSIGQIVYREEINIHSDSYSREINMKQFESGWYTVELINNDLQVVSKVMKE